MLQRQRVVTAKTTGVWVRGGFCKTSSCKKGQGMLLPHEDIPDEHSSSINPNPCLQAGDLLNSDC